MSHPNASSVVRVKRSEYALSIDQMEALAQEHFGALVSTAIAGHEDEEDDHITIEFSAKDPFVRDQENPEVYPKANATAFLVALTAFRT